MRPKHLELVEKSPRYNELHAYQVCKCTYTRLAMHVQFGVKLIRKWKPNPKTKIAVILMDHKSSNLDRMPGSFLKNKKFKFQ